MQPIADVASDARIGTIEACEADGVARLETWLQAYTDDPQARVHRQVLTPVAGERPWLAVIDRIEGPRPHRWTNSWLLPAEEPATEPAPGTLRVRLCGGLHLRVAWAVSDRTLERRDDAMFWCPSYAQKSPARWLRFSGRAAQTVRAFVFEPGADATEKGLPKAVLIDGSVKIEVAGRVIEV